MNHFIRSRATESMRPSNFRKSNWILTPESQCNERQQQPKYYYSSITNFTSTQNNKKNTNLTRHTYAIHNEFILLQNQHKANK